MYRNYKLIFSYFSLDSVIEAYYIMPRERE